MLGARSGGPSDGIDGSARELRSLVRTKNERSFERDERFVLDPPHTLVREPQPSSDGGERDGRSPC
jgi:hypothetical protein